MKKYELRGVCTEEIANKYNVTAKELRLIPYLQYLLVNYMPVDIQKVSKDEREILGKWRDEGRITFSCNHPCTITKEFWDFINNILFDSYIPELCED